MDMFVVRGGRPLRGTVAMSGSKNASLPIMAAVLAVEGPVTLRNVPHLADVSTLASLLTRLGVDIRRTENDELRLEVVDASACVAPYDLVRRMRASICVLGPLLGRRRRACVSLPGGCNIGHRPIDLHLRGLAALGAEISVERGYVLAKADRLRGAVVDLSGPTGSTVTGTCNVLTAACFAEGRSVLTGAACEPEVVDLGEFLIAAGAAINGLGTSTIEVDGGPTLHGTRHAVIPDRIEAATFLIAAAITRGDLRIDNVRADHLSAVIETLRQIGVRIEREGLGLRVSMGDALRPAEVCALPYPGFPTDVQAQLSALLSLAPGTSVVTDHVFPDRFLHLPELCRLGADIRREGASGIIHGVPQFSGASVMASDLRASAALLLAALAAPGDSVIRRIYHLDRGYERLEDKLRPLGADICRVTDAAENVPLTLVPPLEPCDTAGPPPPKFLQPRSITAELPDHPI